MLRNDTSHDIQLMLSMLASHQNKQHMLQYIQLMRQTTNYNVTYCETNHRKASENDSTAHFAMQYGAANGILRRPRILDMLTMRPPAPARFISGRNVRTTRHAPNVLTSNSSVMSD